MLNNQSSNGKRTKNREEKTELVWRHREKEGRDGQRTDRIQELTEKSKRAYRK